MNKPSARDEIRSLKSDQSNGNIYLPPAQRSRIAQEYLKNKRVRQTAEDYNEAVRRGWINPFKGENA